VNFDLPMDTSHQPDYDTYLHRIGRTGRFGKHGLAINMIDGPRSRAMLQQIESYFGSSVINQSIETHSCIVLYVVNKSEAHNGRDL